MAWIDEDADRDGVGLRWDLDPDGDARVLGADEDADGDGEPNQQDLMRAARALIGRPADPLMGRWGDPLGRAGFLVCVDVPVLAYERAGLTLPALLRDAALENPGWFELTPDNTPGDPFFVRRVRNYHDLFQHHPLLQASAGPRAGDWVFYGRGHVALVSRVLPEGGYRAIEASGLLVQEHSAAEIEGRWGEPDFFGRVR